MQNRKICFDTETTGLSTKDGDRIFEMGCVELINDIKTGKIFQCYINPEKKLSTESTEISGIKDEFLMDKPKFVDIYDDFIKFIGDSPIIAHNAGFDIGFLNYEFGLINKPNVKNDVIDTLLIARKKFPGQKVSLDALCKKFEIDNSKRVFHGALLDAELLADVYFQLLGGAERKLMDENDSSIISRNEIGIEELLDIINKKPILQSRKFIISDTELQNHLEFIKTNIKNNVWGNK